MWNNSIEKIDGLIDANSYPKQNICQTTTKENHCITDVLLVNNEPIVHVYCLVGVYQHLQHYGTIS